MSQLYRFAKKNAAKTCYVILAALIGATGLSASCTTDNSQPGCVHFAMRTDSNFSNNYLTNTSDQNKTWFNTHFWRIQGSYGSFDRNLSWYPNAWAYLDSYGFHPDNALVSQHPEWFFHDQYGNSLYIPWGCRGGHCSQYAADFSNPQYRAWFIQHTQEVLARGYKGIWLDDVNLQPRISDGNGQNVMPVDSATGQPMTLSAWERYFADFLTQLRQAIPNAEILHNSIWFAGSGLPGTDPYVQQEIKAADFINMERGVDDNNITGDNGYWSLQSEFRFVDTIHSLGKAVDIQNYGFDGDYGPACYYLVSGGKDAFGNDAITPDNWPSNLDADLGQPINARYNWNGLIRRDFQNGFVAVNVPGAPHVNVSLPAGYTDTDGTSVSTLSLDAQQGIILLGAGSQPQPPGGGVIPDGTYKLQNLHSLMMLDNPGGSTRAGTQMVQWGRIRSGINQSWDFAFSGDSYTITNTASGLLLSDGANHAVTQLAPNQSANQLWMLQPVSGGYVLKNKGTGRVLDDCGKSKQQGQGIITWGANNGLNQVWQVQ